MQTKKTNKQTKNCVLSCFSLSFVVWTGCHLTRIWNCLHQWHVRVTEPTAKCNPKIQFAFFLCLQGSLFWCVIVVSLVNTIFLPRTFTLPSLKPACSFVFISIGFHSYSNVCISFSHFPRGCI
uniref:Uncharacterized protein n=1 Tax=Rhipicephalus zambeziensis TaxID=60191 RepID=A0A224Y781_9ACAR